MSAANGRELLCAPGFVTASYAATAIAQDYDTERVAFRVETMRGGGEVIRGQLRMPRTGNKAAPAVLVLHSAVGAANDRTSGPYVDAINAAGIATLWIEMFPDGRSAPPFNEALPKAFGALRYLSKNPRIDANRIGVLGFSYGGLIAVLAASKELTQTYSGHAGFAAHLALYPLCYIHENIHAGRSLLFGGNTYKAVTGAPVQILAAELDDYDDPGQCAAFVQSLPEGVRKHFSVTTYSGAFHAFDSPGADLQVPNRSNMPGRKAMIRIKFDPALAKQSIALARHFFVSRLATNR